MTPTLARAIREGQTVTRSDATGPTVADSRRNAGVYIGRDRPTQRTRPRGHKQSIRRAHPHVLGFSGRDWRARVRDRWQGSRDDAKRIVRDGETVTRRKASKRPRTDGGWKLVQVRDGELFGDKVWTYRRPDGTLIRGDFERDSHGKRVK